MVRFALALLVPLLAWSAAQPEADPLSNAVPPSNTPLPGSALDPSVNCAVCSVNSATGAVTVPTVQRQSSAALDASAGTVTWTFPTTFVHSPTCYSSLASSSTTYTFDVPLVTSISTTAVSLKLIAHPTSVTITSLTLPIVLSLSANPPSGTTVTLTCVGALP